MSKINSIIVMYRWAWQSAFLFLYIPYSYIHTISHNKERFFDDRLLDETKYFGMNIPTYVIKKSFMIIIWYVSSNMIWIYIYIYISHISSPWCWYINTYQTGWFTRANVGFYIPAPWFAYGYHIFPIWWPFPLMTSAVILPSARRKPGGGRCGGWHVLCRGHWNLERM